MTDSLVADELRDLKVDGDRQVFVDDTGDLAQTSGIETVKQSVMLTAGDAVRQLVGEPTSAEVFEDVQQRLHSALSSDPQLSDVQRVDVTEVNEAENSVSVRVVVSNNNDFEIDVDGGI